MRCDVIAEGIIEAAKNLSVNIPIVVRLQGILSLIFSKNLLGTKMEEAKALIGSSGLNIMSVDELGSAAKLVYINIFK